MPDFHGADQSIERANMLDRLCVDEIRGVVSLRSQAMSQQELARYNSPNMQPAIYPESAGANHPSGASPDGGSSTPSSRRGEESSTPESERGKESSTPAAPPTSRSPFPSGSEPAPSAGGGTPAAPLPSSSHGPAPASSATPVEDDAATTGRGIGLS